MRIFIFILVILILVTPFVILNLRLDSRFENFFPKDSKIIKENEYFKRSFGLSEKTIFIIKPIKNISLDFYLTKIEKFFKDNKMKYIKINKNGEYFYFILNKLNRKEFNDLKDLESQIENKNIKVFITGSEVLREDLLHYMWNDLIKLTIISLIFIFLVFYFSFNKDLILSLKSLVILASSLMFTYAILIALDIKITFSTIMLNSFVLGLGIDYVIHLKNAKREDFNFIAKSVFLAFFTTLISFFVLFSSQMRSLREFSLSIIIALSLVFVISYLIIREDKMRE